MGWFREARGSWLVDEDQALSNQPPANSFITRSATKLMSGETRTEGNKSEPPGAKSAAVYRKCQHYLLLLKGKVGVIVLWSSRGIKSTRCSLGPLLFRHLAGFSWVKMTNTGGRRLKQWLMEQIQSGQYAGLQWEDESRTLFRIPWKHAGKQDYNQEVDASIFKVWHQSQRQKITGMPGIRIYSFLHRPGLFLKASTRRGTRRNLPPGRPDFAALWIKALTSRRWPSAHSSTFLNLTKSTASCLRKSRRVSWFHLHLHSSRWLDCPTNVH